MDTVKWIVTAYFVLILVTGVFTFIRVRTAGDFYVSGKRGSLWQIAGSLFATVMGGSAIFGTLELGRNAGWAGIWLLGSAAAGLLVLATFAGRVSRLGRFTLPEMLRDFYGVRAERTASLMIPAAWTGVIAVQIMAGARILSGLQLTGIREGAWICGLAFLFYTLAGGQKGVLKTDFLQALIILAGITALFALQRIHSAPGAIPPLRAESLFNGNFSPGDLALLLLTYSVTFVVGPDIYSRIYCARNGRVARNGVMIAALLLVPVAGMLTSLAMGGGDVFLPGSGGPALPPWAVGVAAITLLSAVMSSADTTLLTSSMILSELFTGNLEKKGAWAITRVNILLLGAASLAIALRTSSILNALLISLAFFSGAFILPLAVALAGLKVIRRRASLAMIAGGVTAVAGKILQQSSPGAWGPVLILLAYFINGAILFIPISSGKERQKPGSLFPD